MREEGHASGVLSARREGWQQTPMSAIGTAPYPNLLVAPEARIQRDQNGEKGHSGASGALQIHKGRGSGGVTRAA